MDFEINMDTVIDIFTELVDRFGEEDPDLNTLNEYERTIFVTQALESEVNNGGFIQLIDNCLLMVGC